MLGSSQVRFYNDNGYLLVEDVLSPDEVSEMQSAISELIEQSRTATKSDAKYVLGGGHSAETPQLRRVTDPEKYHPAFETLRHHEGILDVVESLLGLNLRFDHGKLNIKEPGGDDAVIEWHQDWAFYPHTNGDMLAVGILLDDCDEENGPLMVLPGSHAGPILDHNEKGTFTGATDIRAAGLDNEQAISLAGRAGSITLHHVRTLHASKPNRGDRARLLMLNSYKAADCWPILGVPDLDWYHGCMVRGETSWTPRLEANPVRIPADLGQVGLFKTQETVRGRSFGDEARAET